MQELNSHINSSVVSSAELVPALQQNNTQSNMIVVEPQETDAPIVRDNRYIDQISMQLLLNRTHYQKYLSKTDAQKFAEYQEFTENCARFRRPIVDITSRLLDNPQRNGYSGAVLDAFDQYSKTLIRYLEVKEMSDKMQTGSDEDNEDVLFPQTMDTSQENNARYQRTSLDTGTNYRDGTSDEFTNSRNEFFHMPYIMREKMSTHSAKVASSTMDRFVVRK